jgi:dTDP-4-dehydrorhamnose 3,5-epimerase
MNVRPTTLPGVLIITPRFFHDERGRFAELYKATAYAGAGIPDRFVQDNLSHSAKHTIRGLHFQHPDDQGKLVTCLHGAILDVIVDVRPDSPTFGQHVAAELGAVDGTQVWVPAGYAHGFCAREDGTIVVYKCTAEYAPHSERSVRWDDPTLDIAWPTRTPRLSAKDAVAPLLAEIPRDHLPRWSA